MLDHVTSSPERADRVREVAPRLYGMPCGAVTAAKIIGETALVARFSGKAALRNMPVWPRFRTGLDAPPDGCGHRNTAIANLIRRSIASPSRSFDWTAHVTVPGMAYSIVEQLVVVGQLVHIPGAERPYCAHGRQGAELRGEQLADS